MVVGFEDILEGMTDSNSPSGQSSRTNGDFMDDSPKESMSSTSPPITAFNDEQAKAIIGEPIKIESLYMIGGHSPPRPQHSMPITPEVRHDIDTMYRHEYGRGIDMLFETSWFAAHGLDCLYSDQPTLDLFISALELFQNTRQEDYEAMRMLPSTEARLVWNLMCLPRGIKLENGMTAAGTHPQLDSVLRRLTVFELLITGQSRDWNPIKTPAGGDDDAAKFWYNLGHFVLLHNTGSAPIEVPISAETRFAMQESLAILRNLCDGKEGRDALYSIALVRYQYAISERVPEDEQRALDKARWFLENEAAQGGTNQAIQRICGMAVRSWGLMRR